MIQSVDRALLLLNEVARHGGWVGVRELARATGLKPPTAHNLLRTLLQRNYLDFDPAMGRYRVGIAAVQLSNSLDPVRRMGEFVRPFMEELYRELQDAVVASIYYRGQVIMVDSIQSLSGAATTSLNAVIERPHLMATGKVLLSQREEQEQRRYAEAQSGGAELPLAIQDLVADLRRVREQGHAVLFNAGRDGVAAVAVPVPGITERTTLAIGCSGPSTRFNDERIDAVRKSLQSAAKQMSRKLGAPPRAARKP